MSTGPSTIPPVIESSASKTAMFMAAYRARASRAAAPLCSDPFAEAMAGSEGFALADKYDQVYAHMELWTAVRTAFIDRCVTRSLEAPWSMKQIVLLGAGFDSRAARLARAGVRFFEIDHPDSQAEKRARIANIAGYPTDATTFVSCDFEQQDFLELASQRGFDAQSPALFVWEGVTPYLSEEAVRLTLRKLATRTAHESVVVFDHLRKKIVTGDVADERDKQSRDFVHELGEPLKWGCDDILPVLYHEGFRRVRSVSFDEVCLELTGSYERERKFRFQSFAVASRARRELP